MIGSEGEASSIFLVGDGALLFLRPIGFEKDRFEVESYKECSCTEGTLALLSNIVKSYVP